MKLIALRFVNHYFFLSTIIVDSIWRYYCRCYSIQLHHDEEIKWFIEFLLSRTKKHNNQKMTFSLSICTCTCIVWEVILFDKDFLFRWPAPNRKSNCGENFLRPVLIGSRSSQSSQKSTLFRGKTIVPQNEEISLDDDVPAIQWRKLLCLIPFSANWIRCCSPDF
jgi:hypothetical protein